MPDLSRTDDLADRLARLMERARWLIVLGVAVLVGLAGWRAARLELHTNLAELLPTDDPAVVTLNEASRRLASVSSLTVVVQSPSPGANRAFVDDLVPRLRRLKEPVIEAVDFGVAEETAFFRHNKFLYANSTQLKEAHEDLRQAIARRQNLRREATAPIDFTRRGTLRDVSGGSRVIRCNAKSSGRMP